MGRLYALSQEMMLFEDADKLIRNLPGLIDRIFALDGVILYICDHDRFYSSSGEAPASIRAHMQALTAGLNPTLVTLSGYHSTSLTLGMRSVGALAWRPESLSREVSAAISAQVSIAVARSIAIETTARVEAAREGERLRTALIDSLTHELRTPLTSIRAASTTLVESEGLDEAARLDMAHIIDEEAARLDLLIGEAVEMAEIDANVVKVKMSPQNPRALLDQAVEAVAQDFGIAQGEHHGGERKPFRRRWIGLRRVGLGESAICMVRSATAGPGPAPPARKRGQLHAARQPREVEQRAQRRPAGVLRGR